MTTVILGFGMTIAECRCSQHSEPTLTRQWTRCIRQVTRRYTSQPWLERTMLFSYSLPEVCKCNLLAGRVKATYTHVF